jgi:hypothetical protein
MKLRKLVMFAVVLLAITSTAFASNFRAADTIYLPSAGKVVSGSVEFVTDAYITNHTNNTVVVSVGFGISGQDNSAMTQDLRDLATALAPGERRLVADITGTLFPERTGQLGFLVFFACKEDGDCSDCDANPADCSLISVESRIYSRQPGNAQAETKGQLFPGYPWYTFVSQNDAALNLDTVTMIGFRNEGVRGQSGFRSNIGLLNASQDYSTVLTVTAYNGDGTLAGAADVTLPPLGHQQSNIASLVPAFTTDNNTGYVVVSQKSATLVPGGCAECAPGFFTFGSVLDNIGDDATTLESIYVPQLDIGCVYGAKADRHPVRRPTPAKQ